MRIIIIILLAFSCKSYSQITIGCDSTLITVIGTGQSGMANRACNNTGGNLSIDGRVKSWNTLSNTLEIADDVNTHDLFQNTLLGPNNNQLAWQVSKNIVQNWNRTNVELLVSAKGSRSITEWATGAAQYVRLQTEHIESGFAPADIFLWHQGEDDFSMSVTEYKARFLQMITDLKNDGIISNSAQIVVGELLFTGSPQMNVALQQLANENNNIKFASASNNSRCDNFHYNGTGLDFFGIDYYNQLSRPLNITDGYNFDRLLICKN